jgi:hypothetical protein
MVKDRDMFNVIDSSNSAREESKGDGMSVQLYTPDKSGLNFMEAKLPSTDGGMDIIKMT